MWYNIFMIKNNFKVKGVYTLEFTTVATGEKEVYKIDNLIMDTGLNNILASLTGFSHICMGDDDTAVTPADTKLANETYRRPVQTINTVGNKMVLATFLELDQGNGEIKEIGLVTNGTATTDSGDLFSRVTGASSSDLPKTKTNLQTLAINYELIVVNGS